jgi:ferritin-like metal-binding protein YciE
MEKLNDLSDLLTHEIHDLLSAEDQIIEALPEMIAKATDPALKAALKEHLRITGLQHKRLDQVNNLLGDEKKNHPDNSGISSFLAKLFGSGVHKCKGMEGIINEGKKIMALDMNAEVLDAAIIASAQKIEHYEICGYGTAKAFAKELHLSNVWVLLQETLQEEYAADALLTRLATGGVNDLAENAGDDESAEEDESDAPRPKKAKTAAWFYGTGKGGPKKAPAAAQSTARGPKKNVSPNRRQVPPKPAEADNRGNKSSSKSSGNKSAAGSRGSSKSTPTNNRKSYSSGAPSKATGGARGGSKKASGRKTGGGRK